MPGELETPNSQTPPGVEPPTPPSLITTPPTEATPPVEGTPPAAVEPPAVVEPVAPLTVEDITLPEGFEVSNELRSEFVDFMNKGDLSPKERAQGLIDLQAKAVQSMTEAQTAAWTDMQTKWQDEVRSDPAYASDDKLQPALGRIGKLISEYGTPELPSVFDLTGSGNNIHVVKFLDNIAQKLTEGGPVSGAPPAVERSAASKMFPSMKG